MAEIAQAALYRAIKRRLETTFGARAYPDLAPAGAARPYVVFFWLAGGSANRTTASDAELVMGIKCVANTLAEAFAGAAQIAAGLDDADRWNSSTALDGGTDWWIESATQGLAIHMVETIDGVQVYHAGHQYRFRLEEK